MTIETRNLVIARVNLVREVYGLYRLVSLLIAEPAKGRALQHYSGAYDRHYQRDYSCGSQAHLLTS
jgi:hypothetical protein